MQSQVSSPFLNINFMAYRPVAGRWLCKHQPLLGNARTQQWWFHNTWRIQQLLWSVRSLRVCGDVTQQKRWCRHVFCRFAPRRVARQMRGNAPQQ
jgi:hypothetical protein